MGEMLLQLEGISKSFVSNKVLDAVSAEFEKGKCYAVVGENGAGKSTLMKIIGGIYRPDPGRCSSRGKRFISFPHQTRSPQALALSTRN